MPADYIFLTYRFVTREDARQVAATLCAEQSTAQWQRPNSNEDLRPDFAAKVVLLQERGDCTYQVKIAVPHKNFGPRLPNLLSVAAGEGPFYCPGIETIKWIDVEFPETLLRAFAGPRFGITGLRKLLDIHNRPFFFGVVKPNIGLGPKDFAELAYQAWSGGLDVAKDDEMLGDVAWSPLAERVTHVTAARRRAERETGEKKLYGANITDEVDVLPRLYQQATAAGANAVMINSVLIGLSALRSLRARAQVPVISHFTGMALYCRQPDFGISALVLTKLQRLAGADIIILAGFGERMVSPEAEVLENITACLKPWGKIQAALPVPGGSDSVHTFPLVARKIGHPNFGFICGRGIFAHPEGPAQAARELRSTWEQLPAEQ